MVVAGQSWQGRAVDRVYTLCDDRWDAVYQAEAGTRTVEMVARHPGRDEILASNSIDIDLECPGLNNPMDGAAGCATLDSKGAPPWTALVLAALVVLRIRRRR